MRKIILTLSLMAVLLIAGTAFYNAQQPPKIRNVILLIGDGMGASHIGLLESYARFAPNNIYQGQPTALQTLALQSQTLYSLTSAKDALVVDSACSATQLATGLACRSEMIGLDIDGNPAQSVLEKAKSMGKATGLVSDTRISHATPAAFAAHRAHRSQEAGIAEDLIHNQVDVLLSGGLSFFIPQSAQTLSQTVQQRITAAGLTLKSKRQDNLNLLKQAEQQGYRLAFSRAELAQTQHLPVLGLFQNSVMPDAISERQDSQRSYPSLEEMTAKALELLEPSSQGFFLMIEAGQIDWAAHNNDAGGLLHELLKFDRVLNLVFNWAKARNDTLIVVTADHETGGFGFSYHQSEPPPPQTLSGSAFSQQPFAPQYNFVAPKVLDQLYAQSKGTYFILQDALTKPNLNEQAELFRQQVHTHLGLELSHMQASKILSKPMQEYDDFFVYHSEKPLNKLAAFTAKESGIVWSTGTHTAAPVPVFIWSKADTTPALNGLITHPQLGQFLHNLMQ